MKVVAPCGGRVRRLLSRYRRRPRSCTGNRRGTDHGYVAAYYAATDPSTGMADRPGAPDARGGLPTGVHVRPPGTGGPPRFWAACHRRTVTFHPGSLPRDPSEQDLPCSHTL